MESRWVRLTAGRPPVNSAATWRWGDRPKPRNPAAREHQVCAALAPALRAEGLFFVGIDVIGGMLSEISHVTSPTGIRERWSG